MPPTGESDFPPARHVVDYLTRYEQRYDLPVQRPVRVTAVRRTDADPASPLLAETSAGDWVARTVISATGTWGRPFLPRYPGMRTFGGRQLHSAQYTGPEPFAGLRVMVVGGGNTLRSCSPSCRGSPRPRGSRSAQVPPDDVDGRALFSVATARRKALDAGLSDPGGVAGLGDVVMVPPVGGPRPRGPSPGRCSSGSPAPARRGPTGPRRRPTWSCGARAPARPGPPAPLALRGSGGRIPTTGTRSVAEPRLHLLGYGDWTGPASATLVGVGRTAREAVHDITARLQQPDIGASAVR